METQQLLVAITAAFASSSMVTFALSVVLIIAMWKIFTKTGHAGWLAIIPFANMYVMCKISFGRTKEFWTILICSVVSFIVMCVGFVIGDPAALICMLIGLVLLIIAAVIGIKMSFALAKSFGQGTGFGFGLLFLPFIFQLILGFGAAQYVGSDNVKA